MQRCVQCSSRDGGAGPGANFRLPLEHNCDFDSCHSVTCRSCVDWQPFEKSLTVPCPQSWQASEINFCVCQSSEWRVVSQCGDSLSSSPHDEGGGLISRGLRHSEHVVPTFSLFSLLRLFLSCHGSFIDRALHSGEGFPVIYFVNVLPGLWLFCLLYDILSL